MQGFQKRGNLQPFAQRKDEMLQTVQTKRNAGKPQIPVGLCGIRQSVGVNVPRKKAAVIELEKEVLHRQIGKRAVDIALQMEQQMLHPCKSRHKKLYILPCDI